MTNERSAEDRIQEWLLATAPGELPDRVLADTYERTRPMSQTSGVRPWRNLSMRPIPVMVATGAVAIVLVTFIAIGSLGPLRDSLGTRSTASPAPGAPALVWTSDAVARDWPGPIRNEVAGGAGQLYRIVGDDDAYVDGIGDIAAQVPWTDITQVRHGLGIELVLAGGLSSVPGPDTSWIAYGVVVDLDGDGRADQRIGIDNSTPDHREWITDLTTGRTAVNASGVYGAFEAFGTRIETWFVDGGASPRPLGASPRLIVKRRTDGIVMPPTDGMRFYAWASTISGGSIVATDFAPDAGWIETGGPPTERPPNL